MPARGMPVTVKPSIDDVVGAFEVDAVGRGRVPRVDDRARFGPEGDGGGGRAVVVRWKPA